MNYFTAKVILHLRHRKDGWATYVNLLHLPHRNKWWMGNLHTIFKILSKQATTVLEVQVKRDRG
jgi:hypothetical protein